MKRTMIFAVLPGLPTLSSVSRKHQLDLRRFVGAYQCAGCRTIAVQVPQQIIIAIQGRRAHLSRCCGETF